MYEEKEKCILASPLFGNGVKKRKRKKSVGRPAGRQATRIAMWLHTKDTTD